MFCLSKMMFLSHIPWLCRVLPSFRRPLAWSGVVPRIQPQESTTSVFLPFSGLAVILEASRPSPGGEAQEAPRHVHHHHVALSLLQVLILGSHKDTGLRPGQPPGLFALLPSRPTVLVSVDHIFLPHGARTGME